MSINCVALLSLMIVATSSTYIPDRDAKSYLANYMLERRAQVANADPVVTAQCFALYLPLLQNVATRFSTDYKNCVSRAANERENKMAQMRAQQLAMSNRATCIVDVITDCQAINETLDFFNCFASLSQNVLNTVYSITNNATDDASSLTQGLQLIDVSMYKCTNYSQRTYVEQTANVYDALDHCLQNGLPSTAATDTPTTEVTADTDSPTTRPEDATTTDVPTVEDASTDAENNKKTIAAARSFDKLGDGWHS